jgi:hypothetical protein
VPLPLEAGRRVPPKIEYRHGEGHAGIHLMWQRRTQDRQHVPTRHLFPPAVAPYGAIRLRPEERKRNHRNAVGASIRAGARGDHGHVDDVVAKFTTEPE